MGNTDPVPIILEEYKALRAEVNSTMDRQYAMMYWSLSAAAVLIAAIISSLDKLKAMPALAILLFGLVIPLLCSAYVVSWSDILLKIVKLGAHLYVIEERISAELTRSTGRHLSRGSLPISWEHFVNEPGDYGYRRTCTLVKWGTAVVLILLLVIAEALFRVFYWDRLSVPLKSASLPAEISVFLIWTILWNLMFRVLFDGLQEAMKHRASYLSDFRAAQSAQ